MAKLQVTMGDYNDHGKNSNRKHKVQSYKKE